MCPKLLYIGEETGMTHDPFPGRASEEAEQVKNAGKSSLANKQDSSHHPSVKIRKFMQLPFTHQIAHLSSLHEPSCVAYWNKLLLLQGGIVEHCSIH
ncbi:hypothetical protein Leryth_026265 [Lithospermum erythrorhizon]|nr:hypothetical protein Leryth_026265 [Lithospermum erythrorhizon]